MHRCSGSLPCRGSSSVLLHTVASTGARGRGSTLQPRSARAESLLEPERRTPGTCSRCLQDEGGRQRHALTRCVDQRPTTYVSLLLPTQMLIGTGTYPNSTRSRSLLEPVGSIAQRPRCGTAGAARSGRQPMRCAAGELFLGARGPEATASSTGPATERDLARALSAGLGPDHPISRFAVQHPVLVTSDVKRPRRHGKDAARRDQAAFGGRRRLHRWHRVQPRRYVCLLESLSPQTWVAPLREALSSPTEIWPSSCRRPSTAATTRPTCRHSSSIVTHSGDQQLLRPQHRLQ